MTKATGKGRGRRPGFKERDAILSTLGTKSVPLGRALVEFHVDEKVTQRIVDATPFGELPPECSVGGARFKDLQHNIQQAILTHVRKPGPTRVERLAHLRRIEQAAEQLRGLLETEVSGRPGWADINAYVDRRIQRRIENVLGDKASAGFDAPSGRTTFDGLLDHHFFIRAAKATALLARHGHVRVKKNQHLGLYDRPPSEPNRNEFFERLAWAQWEFAKNNECDLLVRFVRAVSGEFKMGIPDSAPATWCRQNTALK